MTNDANTNTYMGHEYYSDDDFNHEISLDCLITNSTYEVEYILTHYHTGYLVDAGWWNFTATGPTASITETWSNLPIQIWYAVTAMYTFDNGVTISDYEKFYVNSTTGPDLLGYCSFPTFEATPAAVEGEVDVIGDVAVHGPGEGQIVARLHRGRRGLKGREGTVSKQVRTCRGVHVELLVIRDGHPVVKGVHRRHRVPNLNRQIGPCFGDGRGRPGGREIPPTGVNKVTRVEVRLH